jgi:phage tail-like protein
MRTNPHRVDPYKNFGFRVKWRDRYVAGVSEVSALSRTTEVVKHREGGDSSDYRKIPGQTKYEPITLKRGVTHDTEFADWARGSSVLGKDMATQDLRPEIVIEVHDEAGREIIVYKVHRCWVSKYQALADLDANANAVAIEHLTLENEGWERDIRVKEPTEPDPS